MFQDTGQGPWCPTKVRKNKNKNGLEAWAYCDLKPKSPLSLKKRLDNRNASKTDSVSSTTTRSVKKKKSAAQN